MKTLELSAALALKTILDDELHGPLFTTFLAERNRGEEPTLITHQNEGLPQLDFDRNRSGPIVFAPFLVFGLLVEFSRQYNTNPDYSAIPE